jgi:hypothetical protein
LLAANRIAVEQVAVALMERATLTGDEIRHVIRAADSDNGQSTADLHPRCKVLSQFHKEVPFPSPAAETSEFPLGDQPWWLAIRHL